MFWRKESVKNNWNYSESLLKIHMTDMYSDDIDLQGFMDGYYLMKAQIWILIVLLSQAYKHKY